MIKKKIQFSSDIVFSTKKFKLIKKKKDSSIVILDSMVNCAFSLPELRKRIHYILSLISDCSTNVSLKICDTEEMRVTNFSYKGKNYPTDVLSFPNYISEPNSNTVYLGDILICFPVCYEQAICASTSITHELEKMLIHGIIHLKGFDHERNQGAWRVMSKLEEQIQKELTKELGKPNWCKVTAI